MDAYKNLPAPARIAIPVVLALMVVFIAYSTMFKQPPPTELLKSNDVELIGTAKEILGNKGIAYDVTQNAGSFSIAVPTADATDAAEALAASGIKDRTGLAKAIKCPSPPGFTATRAANVRSDNCEDAKAVQEMLLTAGALAANVRVSQQESDSFAGPEMNKNVVAQVFLPKRLRETWNAQSASVAIKGTVGTSIERVFIGDDQLHPLFDGSKAGTAAASANNAGAGGDCGAISKATEVETKKNAVRECYREQIGTQLDTLLGASDRYTLVVEPTIDTAAKTTVSTRNTPGPAVNLSQQSSDGTKSVDKTSPANTTQTTSVTAAGAVSALAITATLNKQYVGEGQELAVKRILSNFTRVYPKSPAPVVTVTAFADAGTSAKDEVDKLKSEANKAKQNDVTSSSAMNTTAPAMPKWALALIAVLGITVVVAMLVLWRRSAAMAAERARLEDSFRQDQRLFENFAQQNPDALAADLNALFGAPSAPEPATRY